MIGIIILICLIVLIVLANIAYKRNYYDIKHQKSLVDDKYYLVKNDNESQQSADLLADINKKIQTLNDYMYSNINKDEFTKFKPYILKLNKKIKKTIICENVDNLDYTSYTINKGEKVAFCLHSKKFPYNFHDSNLITYVALHEISHIACPEVGHTELFKEIFAFFTQRAIDLNLYKYEDFKMHPKEYCGMDVNDSII